MAICTFIFNSFYRHCVRLLAGNARTSVGGREGQKTVSFQDRKKENIPKFPSIEI